MTNYRDLGKRALQMALRTRGIAGADLISPTCPYDICEELGIGVKFVQINMEGMYVREPKPRIIISALRPLVRRNFTCGHELGHHVFGHGSSLDQLINDRERPVYTSPEEFLADSFASSLLLPALGVRKAFSRRSWSPSTATPTQILTIASDFGVGYSTLIKHLAYSLRYIDLGKAKVLLKSSPQAIRKTVLGSDSGKPLVILDKLTLARTIDIEVGSELLVPHDSLPANDVLAPDSDSPLGNHFIAVRPGICRVASGDNSWAIFVRVMPFQFEGLAKYRNLDRGDEDD
jgi:hypothetical protein